MRPIAQANGVSMAQIALAWLLHQPHVTSVIIGAKRVDQLADNLGATQVVLSADELANLDEVSRLPAEYLAGCSNVKVRLAASNCSRRDECEGDPFVRIELASDLHLEFLEGMSSKPCWSIRRVR